MSLVPGDLWLVTAKAEHAAYWLKLRNDVDAVQWSRTTKPIDPATHHVWFADSLTRTQDRGLYLIALGQPDGGTQYIGIGRLDRHADWTELSIVLDREFRGCGLGRRAIQVLASWVGTLGWPEAGAVVNGRNRRSLRTFIKAGFTVRANRFIELRKLKTKGGP